MRCVKMNPGKKNIECIVTTQTQKSEVFRYTSLFAFAVLQLAISCYEDKFSIKSDMKILCQNCHSKIYS